MSEAQEVIKITRELIETVKVAVMSTVDDDQPCVRPMAAFQMSDTEIWFATFRGSRKVEQIQKNPHIELCFMDAEYNHVRLKGTAVIKDDAETRNKLWDSVPDIGSYFKSADDPTFVIIVFTMERLEYLEHGLGKVPSVVIIK